MRYIFLVTTLMICLTSCKSEFEKIRSTNDPEFIYKKALKFYKDDDFGKARSLFELVIPFYRGKDEAEELFYKYAYAHFYLGEYILASHYFSSFGKTFYNSEKREEAVYMAAYSNLQMSPNHRLDQSHSQLAIEEFQTFINRFPNSTRITECNEIIDELREKLEKKAFDQGRLYYDLKNYNSAITSFGNMLKDFPDSEKVEEVRYLIVKSSYEWAEKSIFTKKVERFGETLKRVNKFLKKYPKSKYSKELKNIKKNSDNAINELTNV